jgi:hypothetical protein
VKNLPNASLPRSLRYAFRVSHPLSVFLLFTSGGFISSPKRSWDYPLQSFSHRTQLVSFSAFNSLRFPSPLNVRLLLKTPRTCKDCTPTTSRHTRCQACLVSRRPLRFQGLTVPMSVFLILVLPDNRNRYSLGFLSLYGFLSRCPKSNFVD